MELSAYTERLIAGASLCHQRFTFCVSLNNHPWMMLIYMIKQAFIDNYFGVGHVDLLLVFKSLLGCVFNTFCWIMYRICS